MPAVSRALQSGAERSIPPATPAPEPPGPMRMFPRRAASPKGPAGADWVASLRSSRPTRGVAQPEPTAPGKRPGSQGCGSGMAPATRGRGRAVYCVCAGVQVATQGKQPVAEPWPGGQSRGASGVGCHPWLRRPPQGSAPQLSSSTQTPSPKRPGQRATAAAQGTPGREGGTGCEPMPPSTFVKAVNKPN